MNANIILFRANIHNVTAARIRLGIFRDNILYNILCRAIRWDDTRTHILQYTQYVFAYYQNVTQVLW